MRVVKRQPLSRKKSGNMSDRDQEQETPTSQPGTFLPPLDLMGERVFTIRNVRGTPEVPWLESNGQNDLPLLRSNGSLRSSENGRQSPRVSEPLRNPSGRDGIENRKVATSRNTSHRRAVQNFGALLGMRYTDEGHLEVRIASENTRKIVGYDPEDLFALPFFLDVLKNDVRDEMVARIKHALDNADSLKEETRLDVFQITLAFLYEPETRLWCALHIAPRPANMIVCEFEEYLDAFYLKDLRAAKSLPDLPVRSMGFESLPVELKKSTTTASKPLPVLEMARQRRIKEFSSLDLFNALAQAQKQIISCKSVQELLEVTVGIVSELTGFHRVMFYRFDSQKNGCVDAEMLNPQASKDVYRGLHYPASDIPKQARELYKINRIRILHDRAAETARLVCRDDSDYEHPLDLTHASTMSISVVIGGDLWGLIACHGYGDDGIRVSLPIRELCRNISECAAVNIKQISMQQRLEARRPPLVNPNSKNPTGMLATSSAGLLRLVNADFALLSIDEEARAIGRLDPYSEVIAIMSRLHTCQFTDIKCSKNINVDFPGINQQAGRIKTIAGLLLIPLNRGGANDFLVFLKHVKWAGNPYTKDKAKIVGEYLEPRTSVQRWVETIDGTSIEWTEDQHTAWILSLLYSRFIEIWRQKGVNNQGEKLSWIRNSSRELRTPINAAMGYIEMAMENTDLLKLTRIEEVTPQQDDELFNPSLTASRVMKALQKRAQRKSLDLAVSMHENLPTMVKGDGDRFKQAFAYLTGNAFKQSSSAVFDVSTIRNQEHDFRRRYHCLRCESWHVKIRALALSRNSSKLETRTTSFSPQKSPPRAQPERKDSGLAIIARYVRSVDRQIKVTSEPGKGTVFTLELPFENTPTSNIPVPRKLRNLFSPSHGSMKFPSPPSVPPSMRSPRPHQNGSANGSTKKIEAMVNPGSPGTSLHVENGHGMRGEPRNRVPSPYRSKSQPSSPLPDVDRNRSSFTHMHLGYTVTVAADGQEAHDRFVTTSSKINVILMDMKAYNPLAFVGARANGSQMPLVDGALSACMIRFWEKESQHRTDGRDSVISKARVPIIAVTTSLDDDSRFDYIQNSFDGWVIKPAGFSRLDLMLQGVKNARMERDSLYSPSQEDGG
ncbi:related to phytochrome [Phialocephala subalpina]|uniref:Related to phytochrome n=1 Tax=Phialocephala subalpina TaxID=576137 RepID=A0A1L7XVE8_9HELO|nr:related to phytochrome [Phialocephala subalpina]